MRSVIGIIGVLGTLLFGAAFALSFIDPQRVENVAQELLRREVEARTAESLQALERTRIGQFAQRLAASHAESAEAVKQQLKQRLTPLVEAVVAEMRDPECPCRRALLESVGSPPGGRLADWLQGGAEPLTAFIRAKYAEVAGALLREFRLFTGANALMFALLLVVLIVKRGARAQLLPAVVVLLGTVVIVGGLYLFQQNWLHTIVFGDYVGWAYLLYLGLVGALLADLLFNRARVSARIAGSVGGVFGAAVPVC